MRNFLIKAILLKLYLLAFISIATCQTSNKNNRETEKAVVKQAAIKFFRWHETDWENPLWEKNPVLRKKRLEFHVVRSKNGKLDYDLDCPCKIDWNAVNTYFTWMKRYAPIVSNSYYENYRKIIKEEEPKFNRKIEDQFEFEDMFVGTIFRFIYAQDYIYPSNYGVFDSNAKWKIEMNSDTTATATVLHSKKSWFKGADNAFKVPLIKENATWKLYRDVEYVLLDPVTLVEKENP